MILTALLIAAIVLVILAAVLKNWMLGLAALACVIAALIIPHADKLGR